MMFCHFDIPKWKYLAATWPPPISATPQVLSGSNKEAPFQSKPLGYLFL